MDKTFTRTFTVVGNNFTDAGKVSTEIKMILKQLGINSTIIRRVAIASYESEMNVVMYANKADISLIVSPTEIQIVVEDTGPGIPDIELAMKEGFSTATTEMREMGFGAGMGLPNIKRNADIFNIESIMGKGTKLNITVSLN